LPKNNYKKFGGKLKLAIHDLEIAPHLEHDDAGQGVLHVSMGLEADQFIEQADFLTKAQKAELHELWFAEDIQRIYKKTDYGVEVSRKL
jgi:hypothetical protein